MEANEVEVNTLFHNPHYDLLLFPLLKFEKTSSKKRKIIRLINSMPYVLYSQGDALYIYSCKLNYLTMTLLNFDERIDLPLSIKDTQGAYHIPIITMSCKVASPA